MEYSDATPREPACQLDRRLPDPTREQLLDIEACMDQGELVDPVLTRVLYNSWIRQCHVIHELMPYLGPGRVTLLGEVYRRTNE